MHRNSYKVKCDGARNRSKRLVENPAKNRSLEQDAYIYTLTLISQVAMIMFCTSMAFYQKIRGVDNAET